MIMNDANNGYLASGAFLLKTTDGWATWTYDVTPLGISNMLFYPKMPGPIDNKKLYLVMTIGILLVVAHIILQL